MNIKCAVCVGLLVEDPPCNKSTNCMSQAVKFRSMVLNVTIFVYRFGTLHSKNSAQENCYLYTISLYKLCYLVTHYSVLLGHTLFSITWSHTVQCYLVTHCSTHRQQKLIHLTVFNIKRKISLPNFFHKCLDTKK
jgi:hypothetical protein